MGQGYFIQLVSGKLYLADDKNLYLLNNNNQEVHLDWTGFRVSGGLSIYIDN